jgi:parallel beta-helix repeat protein
MKTRFRFLPGLLLLTTLHGGELRVPGDFATVQEAINGASAGDTVLVAAGVWKEKIRLRPGIHLRSAGSDQKNAEGVLIRAQNTILDGSGGDQSLPGVTLAEDSSLDGFSITGTGSYDEALWTKQWDERGEGQSHDDIGHFGTPAVAIAGVQCRVLNNLVHHNGGTGIAIRSEEGRPCSPLVTNNHCFRNMGGGIGSMNGSSAIIRNNTCYENFYAGIGHDNASPLVTGNTCYRNIRAGIGISEGACPVVRQNVCYQNRRAGIGIRTGSETRPVVEDNECRENGMSGIGIEEEAAPIVRNNRCFRNKAAGIGCRDHAAPLLIGNICSENEASGIGSQSANPTILQNQIEGNKTSGIGISGESNAVLIGNVCKDNHLVAVGIPEGGSAFLHRNQLSRKDGMPPIVAILKEAGAVLTENQIEGGGVAGVMIQGSATLIGNTLEGTGGGTGVFVREGSGVLSKNKITGYRKETSGNVTIAD